MAILLCDSFDHYTTIADKWDASYGTVAIGASYGRLGSAGLKISNGDGGLEHAAAGTPATVIVGQACLFENVTDTHILLTLLDGATVQVQIKQEGANIKVYRNATEIASQAHSMVAGIWYYLEAKITINNSTGQVVFKIDGTQLFDTAADEDTQESGNAYCDGILLGGTGSGGASSYTYRDDVLLMDSSGSYCNDFKGDVTVQAVKPTAPGTNAEWNPSAGDNYACVDEASPNTSDYVESATVNALDTYAAGDVSPLTGTVFAVVVNHFSQRTGTAARGVSGVALDTGTPTVGTENTLDSAYKIRQSKMYINARTSAAFTIADVNGAEFGVKLTT